MWVGNGVVVGVVSGVKEGALLAGCACRVRVLIVII